MTKTLIFIAIGGTIGSVLRYLTSVLVNKYWVNIFPLSTLITNVLGCLLIGFFFGFISKNNLPNSDLKYFLITGFCGGYTTFSTFSYENLNLLQTQPQMAILYTLTSVVIGVLAVWIGLILAN